VRDRALLDEIEALGADTVYLIKRADGLWAAHVRHPGAGPSRYAVVNDRTLRGALEGVLVDPEIEDLI